MREDAFDTDAGQTRPRPKRIAVRVILVQMITLALLWLMQARFGT